MSKVSFQNQTIQTLMFASCWRLISHTKKTKTLACSYSFFDFILLMSILFFSLHCYSFLCQCSQYCSNMLLYLLCGNPQFEFSSPWRPHICVWLSSTVTTHHGSMQRNQHRGNCSVCQNITLMGNTHTIMGIYCHKIYNRMFLTRKLWPGVISIHYQCDAFPLNRVNLKLLSAVLLFTRGYQSRCICIFDLAQTFLWQIPSNNPRDMSLLLVLTQDLKHIIHVLTTTLWSM